MFIQKLIPHVFPVIHALLQHYKADVYTVRDTNYAIICEYSPHL